ncbi:MAG: hypothetical protein IJA54_07675 [Tyzzerella sp.]|nr:hypothetical protein [Tyzzerella sp.]
MLTHVTSGITTVIGWIGTVLDAIVGEAGQLSELGPLFAIGISISAIMLGIRVVRGIIWGA